MDFEGQAFRARTAKELKAKKKEDRIPALKDLRTASSDYQYARTDHSLDVNEQLMTERLRDIAEAAHDLEELKKLLGESELLLGNDFRGADHAEHLVKRVELAEITGYVPFVPEHGGLAKKVEDMLLASGQELHRSIHQETYRQYLQDRFPDLELTTQERETVSAKLSPDAFASIDPPMERLAVLIDVLDETITKFSCSGHAERSERVNDGVGEKYLGSAYMAFQTKNAVLINDLQQAFEKDKNVTVEIGQYGPARDGDARYGGTIFLKFGNLVPPEKWIVENGKRTKRQIETECRAALAAAFGVDVPVDENYFDRLLEIQKQYLEEHPEAALSHRPRRQLVSYFVQFNPTDQILREYAEYFRSDEAKQIRDHFIRRAEAVFARFRGKK